MVRSSILALALALVLAGCAPPDTLAQMKDDGIRLQVPLADRERAALRVDVEYGEEAPLERADCVTLSDDVRAEAGGVSLSFLHRGGWQEADGLFGCDELGCGGCVAPSMSRPAADFADGAPSTIVIEDDTRTISLEVDGLFVTRTFDVASPSTVRVGGTVLLDYARPSEDLDTLSATFIGDAQGLPACSASFVVAIPRENDGTGRYAFVVPAPQAVEASACAGPWSGALRIELAPVFVVSACEGVDRCSVEANGPMVVEVPLDVVP